MVGQTAWVIEIEDTTTLFAPFPRINDKRLHPRLLGLDGIYDFGFFPCVEALLEMKAVEVSSATFAPLPRAFRSCSEILISPEKMAIQVPPCKKSRADEDTVTLLFTKSWHQGATGFYLRGGLGVLEATRCFIQNTKFTTHRRKQAS